MPPGPAVRVAVPLPVPPFGIIGLGLLFSATVQLPAIILISLVISGSGLGMGMPASVAGLLALGAAGLSCATSGEKPNAAVATIRIPLRTVFIVPPER